MYTKKWEFFISSGTTVKINSSKLNYSMEITEHISQQESKFTADNKHVKVQMKCFLLKLLNLKEQQKSVRSLFTIS